MVVSIFWFAADLSFGIRKLKVRQKGDAIQKLEHVKAFALLQDVLGFVFVRQTNFNGRISEAHF